MKAPKSFEDGLQRLQDLLAQMQAPETTLAQSLKLYAEAAQLIEYCDATLNGAKLQIEEINQKLQGAAKGETAE